MRYRPATVDGLYGARANRIDFVDVPDLHYLVVDGRGEPGSDVFQAAVAALLPVASDARFVAQTQHGIAARVMPVEAVFWVDAAEPWALGSQPPSEWHWDAMVMLPDPIDEAAVALAVERARSHGVAGVEQVRYARWHEGPALQTLHVGPYDAEAPTLDALREAVVEAGLRPHGGHHEIYLRDPRHTAPDQLRTIVRQPVAFPSEHRVAS